MNIHTNIWRIVLSGVLLLVFTATAWAQGDSYGYLLVAPGGTAPDGGATVHIAGGGEGVFKKGASLGGEVGYLFPKSGAGDGLGTFSVNGGYHFLKAGGKAVPFVTAGYTGFFRSGYINGVNFGGGVNYWFKERVGLRIEFRDNVAVFDSDAVHFLNVRVGLTFR